jgi:hypothetical protein
MSLVFKGGLLAAVGLAFSLQFSHAVECDPEAEDPSITGIDGAAGTLTPGDCANYTVTVLTPCHCDLIDVQWSEIDPIINDDFANPGELIATGATPAGGTVETYQIEICNRNGIGTYVPHGSGSEVGLEPFCGDNLEIQAEATWSCSPGGTIVKKTRKLEIPIDCI